MSARESWVDLAVTSRDVDFVRMAVGEVDEWADELVEELDGLDVSEVAAWRENLDDDGVALVDIAARRCVVRYVRENEPDLAHRAVALFALYPRATTVPWETWVKGLLVVARDAGLDATSLLETAREWGDSAFAERFEIARDALERINGLADVHLAFTSSEYGPGLLEIALNPAGSMASTQNASIRSTGLAGVPDRDAPDEEESGFGAQSDLITLVVSLADEIDAEGSFRTSEIRHDQVPATLFDLDFAEPFLPAVGVVSFSALDSEGVEVYTVYVAELFSDEDVEEWGESAGEGVAVVTRDYRLVVFMLSPFTEEAATVFDAFLERAGDLLDETAPEGWEGEVSIFVDEAEDDEESLTDVSGDDSTELVWDDESGAAHD